MIQLVEFNDEEPIDMSTNCILTPLNYILKNGEDGQFVLRGFFSHHAHKPKKKAKTKFLEATAIKHLLPTLGDIFFSCTFSLGIS